jgi:hypothetical protein
VARIRFPDLVTGSSSKDIPAMTGSSKPSAEKTNKLRKINFPGRYWAALDQQNATESKKEFGSEIKLHDASSHFQKQLEKMEL